MGRHKGEMKEPEVVLMVFVLSFTIPSFSFCFTVDRLTGDI